MLLSKINNKMYHYCLVLSILTQESKLGHNYAKYKKNRQNI